MSHEIRTPLNGIVASTELLLREPDLPAAATTYARFVAESGGLLVNLIGDVLDFSKIEADRLELEINSFSLTDLLDDIAALANAQADAQHLDLRLDLDPTLPRHFRGDGLRLRQILLNLTSNAIKFTPNGGTIDITVSSPTPTADPTPLCFEVRDSGIGMDQATRLRVFNRFTQADTSTTRCYGGTGLGLAISSRLVQMMDGRLEVESAVGQGSTFSFTIPLPACAVGPTPLAESNRISDDLGLHVLVAEDNAINRRIISSQLAKLGCTCIAAANGEDALDALRQGPLPDVILMDCHMPRLDGWETTLRIRAALVEDRTSIEREQLQALPIIALTALARPEDRARCFASGMSGFLSKPIQLTELHNALNSLARRDD